MCTEKAMSPEQRLAYHQGHSLPVMQEIRAWGAQQIDNQGVEPNSGLGKAIGYFERHFERLTLFCKTEGAKLDNNVMEAALKIIVRNRKNAYFYKTPAGAAVAVWESTAICAEKRRAKQLLVGRSTNSHRVRF